MDKDHFEHALSALKADRGVEQDVNLGADDLRELVGTFKGIYEERKGEPFPQEPRAQLDAAVRAVFESWDNRRARDYRRLNRIPHDLGTAVNVQQMVFGNTGPRSGTGVAFTRSNVTGETSEPFGDFLINAQGEDVVAGIRTPRPLAELADELPEAYAQLIETMALLERTYRNMQDVEFTIEDGALYMLQTRNGKRSAQAMARIAVNMVDEGIVTEQESLTALVDPDQIRQLLLPQLDQSAAPAPLANGVNASPGAAAGAIVFTADEAERRGKAGEQVILVRDETTPDDFHGMVEAQGILTARGGKTSHAAIVAVGMGKPAVCGVSAIRFAEDGTIAIGERAFSEGDRITIDGTSGLVYAGDAPLLPPDPNNPYLLRIIEWADRARTLRVRTNADTPEDAVRAREFGAEGIGLCRTEHMFQGEDRLPIVQRMILAGDDEARVESLAALRAFQQGDFEGIFRAMAGLPVTIRLLDPPLHEFLPEPGRAVRARRGGPRDRHARPRGRGAAAQGAAAARGQPDAGHARLPPGHRVARRLPHAGRGDHQRRLHGEGRERRGAGGRDHDPAGRLRGGAAAAARPGRSTSPRLVLRERGETVEYLVGTMIELPRAALLRRRDRPPGRLLLLRHERPHPDDARVQPRRRREQVPHPLPPGQRHHLQPVRDHRPGGRGRAGGAGRGRRRAPRSPASSSASAASTAATRRRSCSSTGPGSTTCRARRSASRPPSSPRAARRWAADATGGGGRVGPAGARFELASLGDLVELLIDGWRIDRLHYADRSGASGPPAAYFELARGASERRAVYVPDDGRALSHRAFVALFRESPAIWKHRSAGGIPPPDMAGATPPEEWGDGARAVPGRARLPAPPRCARWCPVCQVQSVGGLDIALTSLERHDGGARLRFMCRAPDARTRGGCTCWT